MSKIQASHPAPTAPLAKTSKRLPQASTLWELQYLPKGHATVEFNNSIFECWRVQPVWSRATQERNTMTLAGPKPRPNDT